MEEEERGLVVELPDGKLFKLKHPNGRVVEMPNGNIVEMLDGQIVEVCANLEKKTPFNSKQLHAQALQNHHRGQSGCLLCSSEACLVGR
jgi:hypothetical protein